MGLFSHFFRFLWGVVLGIAGASAGRVLDLAGESYAQLVPIGLGLLTSVFGLRTGSAAFLVALLVGMTRLGGVQEDAVLFVFSLGFGHFVLAWLKPPKRPAPAAKVDEKGKGREAPEEG